MVGLIITFSILFIWLYFEVKNAPHMDDEGNIITPESNHEWDDNKNHTEGEI